MKEGGVSMKKNVRNNMTLTRKDLADPNRDMSYKERLIKAASVDLKDNYIINDCGDGYIKIKPIDKCLIVK